MFGILLTLLILIGIFLMVVVLLQAGKGGGLAAMGGGAGTDTFIGGRQAATILTKATWVSGGLFLALAMVLSILSTRRQEGPAPLLREEFQQTAPGAPQPILPGAEPAEPGAQPGAAEEGAAPAGEAPAPGTGAVQPAQPPQQ